MIDGGKYYAKNKHINRERSGGGSGKRKLI